MTTTEWFWQDSTEEEDHIWAAAMGSDGSVVLVGDTTGVWTGENVGASDFVAVKLDSIGNEVWRWQDGGTGNDTLRAVAIGDDDCVVVAGETSESGAWPVNDFYAVKLDTNGAVVWTWRGGTAFDDSFLAAAMAPDGSVVIAGDTTGGWSEAHLGGSDFAAVKLNAEGLEVWRWQGGTREDDSISAAAMADDGSVILAGSTEGSWGETKLSGLDFAAIKLDQNGTETWRYQGGTQEDDALSAAVIGEDGWIVLAGSTDGNWSIADGDSHDGSSDFAAVRLDDTGSQMWRWQGGTEGYDAIHAAAAGEGEYVILVGSTDGDWGGTSSGVDSFAATGLDIDGAELWKWQGGMTHNGTAVPAECTAIATGGSTSSKAVLAGYTWEADPTEDDDDDGFLNFVAALQLDITPPTPAPTPTPTTAAPSQANITDLSTTVAPTAASLPDTSAKTPTSSPTVSPTAPSPTVFPETLGISATPGPTPLLRVGQDIDAASGAGSSSGGRALSMPAMIAVVAGAAILGLFAVGLAEYKRRQAKKDTVTGDA